MGEKQEKSQREVSLDDVIGINNQLQADVEKVKKAYGQLVHQHQELVRAYNAVQQDTTVTTIRLMSDIIKEGDKYPKEFIANLVDKIVEVINDNFINEDKKEENVEE